MSGVYIAGPMRDKPAYNFEAFQKADRAVNVRENLFVDPFTDEDLVIFNPAWNDIKRHHLTHLAIPNWAKAGQWLLDHPAEFDLRTALGEDLDWIAKNADHLVLLPGWEASKGARAERALADALGLKVWLLTDDGCFEAAPEWTLDAALEAAADGVMVTGEVRTTSATGGEKGMKPERLALIPRKFLNAVARVYGYGAKKYAAENWRRRYEFSKSLDALDRHVGAFIDGETYDPESGEHHLAHAAFHCAALITWIEEDGEGVDNSMDDRWPYVLERMKAE